MVEQAYVPSRADIVWITFTPRPDANKPGAGPRWF